MEIENYSRHFVTNTRTIRYLINIELRHRFQSDSMQGQTGIRVNEKKHQGRKMITYFGRLEKVKSLSSIKLLYILKKGKALGLEIYFTLRRN